MKWHAAPEQRRAPSMANKAVKYARQAWRALLPDAPSPFAEVPLHPMRERARTFNDSERERLAAALEEMVNPRQTRGGMRPRCTQVVADAIWCVRGTMARRSEVLALRREQIDLDAELAYLDRHKTDRRSGARTLQLANIMDVIRRRCEICDRDGTPWLFPSPKGSDSGHVEEIDHAYNAACRLAGIVETWDLCVHTLRRDGATKLINEGVDLRVVQKVLGHSDVTTTARYAQANDDIARRAVRLHGVKGGASC